MTNVYPNCFHRFSFPVTDYGYGDNYGYGTNYGYGNYGYGSATAPSRRQLRVARHHAAATAATQTQTQSQQDQKTPSSEGGSEERKLQEGYGSYGEYGNYVYGDYGN